MKNFLNKIIKQVKEWQWKKYSTRVFYNKFLKDEYDSTAKVLYYDVNGKRVPYGVLLPDGTITKPSLKYRLESLNL